MSKAKVSEEDQRQFWQMAMETWKSSGLSVRQFCNQEGLSEPSFYAWRRRLAKVDQIEADEKAVCHSESFIQVSLPQEKPASLELVFSSGHTLRINPGINNKTLPFKTSSKTSR